MKLGHWTFLVLMLIFTGVPIVVAWALHWRLLARNWRVLAVMVPLVTVTGVVADGVAESWHAWYFSRATMLDVFIGGVPVENAIFSVLVAVAIASSVVILGRRGQDGGGK